MVRKSNQPVIIERGYEPGGWFANDGEVERVIGHELGEEAVIVRHVVE
jgi:hypothetical protein